MGISINLDVKASQINHFTAFISGKKLKANVATIDLTPELEMKFSLGGYGEKMSKLAEAIDDRIWAKVLVLSDGNKKIALVTLNVLGLPPNVKPQLLKQLHSFGWQKDNVMLLPSLSHNLTPELLEVVGYCQRNA